MSAAGHRGFIRSEYSVIDCKCSAGSNRTRRRSVLLPAFRGVIMSVGPPDPKNAADVKTGVIELEY